VRDESKKGATLIQHSSALASYPGNEEPRESKKGATLIQHSSALASYPGNEEPR